MKRHGRNRVTQAMFPNGITIFFGFNIEGKLSCVKFDALSGPEFVYDG